MRHSFITDFSTFIGIAAAFSLVVMAISLGGDILPFLDTKSFLIVVGGTCVLTIACFTFSEFLRMIKLLIRTIFYPSENPSRSANNSLEVAEVARKKGLLGLQKHHDLLNRNSFFRKGLYFVIDGIPHEEAERMMREEMEAMLERHRKGASILRKASEISPAMGLIGTLIGLVQMLGNLDDPSNIGPAMALALLTTLYGAILAYMFFAPLASKLERNSQEEMMIMNIYTVAVSSIGKKENPRRLEMLLNALLPPSRRVKYFS